MRRLLLGPCLLVLLVGALPAGDNGPLRVGMVQTIFNDVPGPLVQLATEPFGAVMYETTGLRGTLAAGGEPFAVAKKLSANELQLAVFHGFEFAWVQQKHPELRPLMVAMNSQREVAAFVLVRKDSPATDLAELKGKTLSVPRRTKEHCRLFVERQSAGDGTARDPKAFFGKVVASANVETGLDELCLGKVDATVVDTVGLEFYKHLKPGCFARLRVLKQSDPFPPAVIAYREGTLDEATLSRFRDGLLNAHKSELGREMMKLWKISAFEAVPENFARNLADALKVYPPPEAAAKVSRR